jgi:hypothetical protein
MASQHDNLQSMLEVLGKAQQDGVFSASPCFPWTKPTLRVTGLEHRRLWWLRMGAPLAAAAAVAVVFVGPNLITRKTVGRTDSSVLTSSTPVQVAELATPAKVAVSAPAEHCDYNGDGVVDGRDIQAFVHTRMEGTEKSPQLEAEFLQKCLLGK